VLHTRSGRELFAIGTDVAGRRDPRLESVVGCFVNQLVLRADLRGDPAFDALLTRVRTTLLGADEHQELPFDRLVQALRPRRQPGRQPLFQASVVFENTPTASSGMAGMTLEPFAYHARETKSDVNLVVSYRASGLMTHLEYDADLFERPAAAAFIEQYRLVLQHTVASPGVQLSTLVRQISGAISGATATS
jgi:non-ribosomal peptide synthetase component F